MNFNVFHLLRPSSHPTPYPVRQDWYMDSFESPHPTVLILQALFSLFFLKRLLRSYIRHIILNIPPQLTSVFLDIRAIS